MLIEFKKKNDFSVLTICRDDQTECWEKVSEVGVLHDLVHFVVERQLEFSRGFYGLINEGYSIPDFEIRREERPTELIPANLPKESIQAEFIVGLIQTGMWDGSSPESIFQTIQQVLVEKEITFPAQLKLPLLAEILIEARDLITQWQSLSDKEVLSLSFDFDLIKSNHEPKN